MDSQLLYLFFLILITVICQSILVFKISEQKSDIKVLRIEHELLHGRVINMSEQLHHLKLAEKHVDNVEQEPVDFYELLSDKEKEIYERNLLFQNRIKGLKEEISHKLTRANKTRPQPAEELHPLVKNIPHELIKRDEKPEVAE